MVLTLEKLAKHSEPSKDSEKLDDCPKPKIKAGIAMSDFWQCTKTFFINSEVLGVFLAKSVGVSARSMLFKQEDFYTSLLCIFFCAQEKEEADNMLEGFRWSIGYSP